MTSTQFIIDDHLEICEAFDATKIQKSWSWRNVTLAKQIAIFLIDSKGEINRKSLFAVIETLKQNLFSLLPGRECDAPAMSHLLRILEAFYENQELSYALKRVRAPTNHPGADALIRATLDLGKTEHVLDFHARQAALAALLTSLRQNIGSCFATAPAIMIQQEQPLQFLADIAQLFGIGSLRRILLGVEYSVPLCANIGSGELHYPLYPNLLEKSPWKILGKAPGFIAAFKAAGLKKASEDLLRESPIFQENKDPFFITTPDEIIRSVLGNSPRYEAATTAFKSLTQNALLKAWEYTVASFAEAKADFTKWNLYASLGVKPEEPHGIGQSLHQMIQEKLDRINNEIAACQSRYDHTFAQVKYLEGRMRTASTEKEMNWIRADYQIRRHELNKVILDQDNAHEKGRVLASFYPFLIEFYSQRFIDYFQEVYDVQMHDLTYEVYDDSPAGFRLLYKHGRANPALWTLIYKPQEYIDALCSFFIATEVELSNAKEIKGLEQDLSQFVTTIITTIRSSQFLEHSFQRLAKTYGEPLIKDPLDKLDQIKRKPWAYISGGTMSTLTRCYFQSAEELKVESRWVENEMELLVFYLDLLKELPLSAQRHFQERSERSLLAFSPTHAFLLKPGYEKFREGWENAAYTYTWVRDHWVVPAQAFLDRTKLDERMVEYLITRLVQHLPLGYQSIVKNALKEIPGNITAPRFREHVIRILSYEKWLQQGRHLAMIGEILDQILYVCLPLFSENELQTRLQTLFEVIDEVDDKQVLSHLEALEIKRNTVLTAQDLRFIAQKLIEKSLKATHAAINYPQKILKAMHKCEFAYPSPILFADTNWVCKRFGFLVGPATQELELWTFDEMCLEGQPLTLWNHYLDGTTKEKWGIYTKSYQNML